jgi:hypothetical protein
MKEKNQHAVELGRLGGLDGRGVVKARPSDVAKKAAEIRWQKIRTAEKSMGEANCSTRSRC